MSTWFPYVVAAPGHLRSPVVTLHAVRRISSRWRVAGSPGALPSYQHRSALRASQWLGSPEGRALRRFRCTAGKDFRLLGNTVDSDHLPTVLKAVALPDELVLGFRLRMCFSAKLRILLRPRILHTLTAFGGQALCSLSLSMNAPVHLLRSWRPPSVGKPRTSTPSLPTGALTEQQVTDPAWVGTGSAIASARPVRLARPTPHSRSAERLRCAWGTAFAATDVTPPFTRSPVLICHARKFVVSRGLCFGAQSRPYSGPALR